MVSIVSTIFGMGNESFSVRLFSRRKSMQNLRVPSFFLTRTTALHQGEFEGRIAPPSSISWMCSLTSSTRGGAILLNLSLKGSLFVSFIMCSVASVHPISFLSRENTSWYSIRSQWARLASSSGQSFNMSKPPSFSRIFINSACLSGIVIFGSLALSSIPSWRSNSGDASALGTIFTVTTLPTFLPCRHLYWPGGAIPED